MCRKNWHLYHVNDVFKVFILTFVDMKHVERKKWTHAGACLGHIHLSAVSFIGALINGALYRYHFHRVLNKNDLIFCRKQKSDIKFF